RSPTRWNSWTPTGNGPVGGGSATPRSGPEVLGAAVAGAVAAAPSATARIATKARKRVIPTDSLSIGTITSRRVSQTFVPTASGESPNPAPGSHSGAG